MTKKILIIDDSALMRRIVCDIIDTDKRFEVADIAGNGEEGLELLIRNTYDAVIMDVNMPKMTGIELLKEMNRRNIKAKVVMNSSLTSEGAEVTVEALELGALDFIKKPDSIFDAKRGEYQKNLLSILEVATSASNVRGRGKTAGFETVLPVKRKEVRKTQRTGWSQIVAIACSTGGPKALQSVIPKLPGNLSVPVLIVQHMPRGFTASLAQRLDTLCELKVKEAAPGDVLLPGHVYIAQGGYHMKVQFKEGRHSIVFSDEPAREGVKPCANYMFESLRESNYENIVCVVLTGMGADGTKGIENLEKEKEVFVIAQNQATCAVYGMPRSVVLGGLADKEVALEDVAAEIVKSLEVR